MKPSTHFLRGPLAVILLILSLLTASAQSLAAPSAAVYAAGVGAGWDRYVEYIHRMADAIQSNWAETAALEKTDLSLPEDIAVNVVINRQGEVTKIVGLEDAPALSEPARQALTKALSDRAPYGHWPEEMVQSLGKEREVAVEFYFPPLRPR